MTASSSISAHEQRPNLTILLFATAVFVFGASLASIELTRGTGRIATIWFSNAILLAILLKQERHTWASITVAGFLGNLTANVLAGDDLLSANVLSLANSVEISIVLLVHVLLRGGQDLQNPRHLLIFCLTAIGPATAVSAGLAAGYLSLWKAHGFTEVFVGWYAADALGLATVTPLLMLTRLSDVGDLFHRRYRLRFAAVLAVLACALAIVFLQSALPLLFLMFPPVLIAAFALGVPGALIATVLTLGTGIVATMWGMGPMSLINASIRVQLFVFQLFAAAVALTSIAVASLRLHRQFLAAAFEQAPDFQYVKDLNNRFIAVNQHVVNDAGASSPRDLLGKTDFDIDTSDHAQTLKEEEQGVMAGTVVVQGLREAVDRAGEERWYETTKAPVSNKVGRVIGLVGVTRDVTTRVAIEKDLAESRNRLSLVLAEMADGIAVVGPDLRIVLSNERYRQMFPLTGAFRVPGAFFPTILEEAVNRGEQPDIKPDEVRDWVRSIIDGFKTGGDEMVHIHDGTWLYLRTRPSSGGSATIVVSDVTKLKHAETELRAMAAQLEVLATTDGLTGLENRRSFDIRLGKEVARCKRARLPISLILFDIDRFKAFNDIYGHPAGDECIKRVASTLRHAAKRPADIVARYGGEELAIVLPETDEGGAYFLAEQIRAEVRALALEHQGSDKAYVTISAGVASLAPGDSEITMVRLLSRADEALYIAKGAGRDRVMGWSGRLQQRA